MYRCGCRQHRREGIHQARHHGDEHSRREHSQYGTVSSVTALLPREEHTSGRHVCQGGTYSMMMLHDDAL